MRPEHIEDYLTTVRTGQWFGWDKNTEPRKVYANLIVLDGGNKPTEQECTDGLTTLQTEFDKASGNAKLKALGLTDDEIKAL